MKKLILICMFFLSVLTLNVMAGNCVLSNPKDNQYDNGLITLTVNATWNTNRNVTNVTWHVGSSVFSNSTLNGSRSSTTSGGFTYTLASGSISEGTYTVFATCYNSTNFAGTNIAINSSSFTYTKDATNPTVTLNRPNNGATVSIKGGGEIEFFYTPSDTNLANSTIYLDGKRVKSNTVGGISSNMTNSNENKFSYYFNGNNNSVTWLVEVMDLAGRKTNSTQWTFAVFTSGNMPVTQVITPSGAGATPTGAKTLSVGQTKIKDTVNKYWWVIIIVVAVIIYMMKKEK